MAVAERTAWAGLVTALVALVAYAAVVLSRAAELPPGAPLDDVAYEAPLLWTVGLGVVATAVVHLAVRLRWREDAAQDVRDRDIEVFAQHVSRGAMALGAAGALVLLVLDVEPFWVAQVLFAGMVLTAVLECLATAVAYRRGLPRW